ncbi:SGNH/GDSL hydrolase family protein [Blastococcus sp. TF02A-35]|uniref:SGNH/GDSL hydrolase family protein n=1 Tax=Blastococcus sp. TF02A-35 TaxID=2559612 RepID=UPI00107444C0|nr:SGNH/GDSL hydrolase family protein [Blastococcus sp. TF02A_35]TFV52791.1 SGNH/GDSL hydrolase family protein [Blastococcus sp. TF02A_35]
MRRLAACVLAVAAVLLSLLVAPAAQAKPKAPPAPLQYVALGDSYSAASGVLPPDPTAPPQCLRSIRNYPNVIAAQIGATLTDVTCGGADTGDFAGSQYPGVAPQLEALGQGTQLVTMTIGGNDSSVFINSILSCGVAGLSTLGKGSPCKDKYGDSYKNTVLTTTYPALVQALTDVRARIPEDAEVAILGYPWILPKEKGCFDKMPVAEGDVPYLRDLQATLNDVVRRAAAETGAVYVDLSQVSEGRDACQPIGTRWVEPVLQGTNPVIVHPNALGEAGMAARTMEVLGLGEKPRRR